MKKLKFYLLIIFMVSALFSCKKDDEEQLTKSEVLFSFDFSKLKSISSDTIDSPAAVVVTIEDQSGKTLYNNERVNLYNMNGYFISNPLSLIPGEYKLTKFLVIDKNNKVIYLTPMAGSPKAYLVNNPLPISFNVRKDDVTKVVPQVISALNNKPEDYGYATFSFDILKTFDFLIGVFIYNDNSQNFEMTTAHLTITGDSSFFQKDLPAATDTLTINDSNSKYILNITKDGYNSWSDTLTTDELKLHYRSEDKGPLKVILFKEDAKDYITFATDQTSPSSISLFFNYYPGLFINWGDNTPVEPLKPSAAHTYEKSGIFTFTISGDLSRLTLLHVQNCNITKANVRNSSNLQSLIISGGALKSIDLSGNPNLEVLGLESNELTDVDLSKLTRLKTLSIRYNKIKAIDLSHNLELENVYLDGNEISSVDVSFLKNLKILHASWTKITDLDISSNTKLEAFYIYSYDNMYSYNVLNHLDVSKNIQLKELGFSGLIDSTFNLPNLPLLHTLVFIHSNIASADISLCPSLKKLSIESCPLTQLDISKNQNIQYIQFSDLKILDNNNINKIYTDLNNNITITGFQKGRVIIDRQLTPSGEGQASLQNLITNFNWTLTYTN